MVEGTRLLGLLFLFNNLHAAHHERPSLAWYRLPSWYRQERERLLRKNGGLVYRGYGEVLRRFLLRAHDQPEHPFDPALRGDRSLALLVARSTIPIAALNMQQRVTARHLQNRGSRLQ